MRLAGPIDGHVVVNSQPPSDTNTKQTSSNPALHFPLPFITSSLPMTIQYTLAFAALVSEIAAFFVLAFPAFHHQKARLVRWVTRQPAFQPLKTLLLVIWFLILVLFLDALNRAGERMDWFPGLSCFPPVHLTSVRPSFLFPPPAPPLQVINPPAAPDVPKVKGHGSVVDPYSGFVAKKFYAQRNLYLTGVTLLMAYVVARYYQLLSYSLEMEVRLRESQIRNGAVDSLNREIDDFRRKVNDLDSKNKDLTDKLKKAEKKIQDLTPVEPEPVVADGSPEEEPDTDTIGVGLRKRQ